MKYVSPPSKLPKYNIWNAEWRRGMAGSRYLSWDFALVQFVLISFCSRFLLHEIAWDSGCPSELYGNGPSFASTLHCMDVKDYIMHCM